MAEEFHNINPQEVVNQWTSHMQGAEISFDPHAQLKLRVPGAIGIIPTADTTPFSNVILESA